MKKTAAYWLEKACEYERDSTKDPKHGTAFVGTPSLPRKADHVAIFNRLMAI